MPNLISIQNLPVGVALISLNGDFLEVNEAFAEMFYCKPIEFKSLTVGKVTHQDDLERTAKILGKCINTPGESFKIIKRYLKKSGATFYAQSTIKLVYDENQTPRVLAVTDELKDGFDVQYARIIREDS